MGKFGYIGARPTQSSSSSSGVFSVNDVANALDQSIYPLQSFSLSYLVIAGGGGGGNNFGSGGGAGGYRNSYASETSGGNSSTETPVTITPGTSFTVTVGAGGSGVVILRYPAGNTINVGSGLTSSTATDGDFKVTTFTAGTDTITFS